MTVIRLYMGASPSLAAHASKENMRKPFVPERRSTDSVRSDEFVKSDKKSEPIVIVLSKAQI